VRELCDVLGKCTVESLEQYQLRNGIPDDIFYYDDGIAPSKDK
jgi:hypothetical protein